MVEDSDGDQIAQSTDTGALWQQLQAAKQRDDRRRVRAIEKRMRELGEQGRFTHLSDDQLAAQIRGLTGNRAPKEVLAYSPADGAGLEGAADTATLNRAIKSNERVGIEATLGALLDEWRRRRGGTPGQ